MVLRGAILVFLACWEGRRWYFWCWSLRSCASCSLWVILFNQKKQADTKNKKSIPVKLSHTGQPGVAVQGQVDLEKQDLVRQSKDEMRSPCWSRTYCKTRCGWAIRGQTISRRCCCTSTQRCHAACKSSWSRQTKNSLQSDPTQHFPFIFPAEPKHNDFPQFWSHYVLLQNTAHLRSNADDYILWILRLWFLIELEIVSHHDLLTRGRELDLEQNLWQNILSSIFLEVEPRIRILFKDIGTLFFWQPPPPHSRKNGKESSFLTNLVNLGGRGPAKSFPKIFIEQQLVLSLHSDSPDKNPASQSFKMIHAGAGAGPPPLSLVDQYQCPTAWAQLQCISSSASLVYK